MLCAELGRRGHHVVWWASTLNHFTKTLYCSESRNLEVGPFIQLQFLHGRPYVRNISIARLRNHREIACEFRRLSGLSAVPDIVVCSFPTIELSDEAVAFGRRTGVPVLLDVRDLWPDEMVARFPRPLRWIAPIALRRMYAATSRAFLGATGVIGISRAYLDWGLDKARRQRGPWDAVIPHGYPDPLIGDECDANVRQLPTGVIPERKIFWFVGTFVGSIDLATVIDAARLLRDQPEIQFVLTGTGERETEWRRRADGLNNVVFTGWADRRGIAALARVAYAGLGAYKRGALMSLTNKIFEYIGFGLPVIACLPGEARELIEGSGVGMYYEAGNPESLAGIVRSLAVDSSKRAQMSRSARELFERNFSAESVYGAYADHLERVVLDAGRDTVRGTLHP